MRDRDLPPVSSCSWLVSRVTPLGQDPQENEHVRDRNWGGCCMFIDMWNLRSLREAQVEILLL